MPYRANYPATVAEVLRPNRKYKPDVLRALKAFRRRKPWQGSDEERAAKLYDLHRALCAAYRKQTQLVIAPNFNGCDCYRPRTDVICLGWERMSVVTYLHEFGHALGKDERQTCIWSINLFRRVFPRSFARCRQERHTLRRP